MEYQIGEKVYWLNGGKVESGFISKIIDHNACYTQTHKDGCLHYNQRHELFPEQDSQFRVEDWKDNYDKYITKGQ